MPTNTKSPMEIFLEIAFLIAVLLVSLQLQSNAISKLK